MNKLTLLADKTTLNPLLIPGDSDALTLRAVEENGHSLQLER